jgi:hypothetical protein
VSVSRVAKDRISRLSTELLFVPLTEREMPVPT